MTPATQHRIRWHHATRDLTSRVWSCCASAALLFTTTLAFGQDGEVIFAVVTKVSKDRRQVTAQVSVGGTVTEAALIPSDQLLDNLVWKKLEVCHSLKAEGSKTSGGYRVTDVKMLDAGMLPMSLQGLAGDCLLKKALEFAPQID